MDDNLRRRATDPKAPELVQYGLEHHTEDGAVLQFVVWSKTEPTKAQREAMMDGLLRVEEAAG